MAASTSSWPVIRPVKTCTECKQSKLRCDSKDQSPNPCSRCHARQLTCTVDPSFRRTPARKCVSVLLLASVALSPVSDARLEAMSKELNELRTRQGVSVRAPSTTSTESGISQDASANAPYSTPLMIMDDFDLDEASLNIGVVSVNCQSAVDAFEIFTAFFHPHLPLIGTISVNNIYHSSPFLFWSIVAIVASHTTLPSDESLYERINEPFQRLVKEEALEAPLPLHNIHALLFLCLWPLPVDKQSKDPSWLYLGIAVNSAFLMGLHRPGPPPSRSIRLLAESSHGRAMTWLGCFYVSSSLSMHLGLPAMINTSADLVTIAAYLNEYAIPRDFAAEIKLQVVITNFTNVLSNQSNDGTVDSSILQLLDRELDTLRVAFSDQWTRMLEYSVLVGKVHFHALVITRGRLGAMPRGILLKLALSASLRIIHLANARFHEHVAETHGLPVGKRQKALPKHYFKGLAFTTGFLLRYFSLNITATAEEQQLAANHVVLSHTIFKACATNSRDEWGRMASLFETLCQQAPMASDPHRLQLSDRMGVFMLLDAIQDESGVRGDALEMTEPQLSALPTMHPDPSNMGHPDMYGVSLEPPWGADMPFTNEFWSDPVWEMFNLPGAAPNQFHSRPLGMD
ncbi:Uu.00g108950.m01.CDS01 [Anthostomella pinea]|uniref:Uu.00g108950.m01.CDS01 n=1 Tax=Anthostomella pinea TaxID=933095 RepID=A0AAI8VEI3_9PEZI|nr:Uu.00g108950.m01.CDS01 [Anthostomella pinea]